LLCAMVRMEERRARVVAAVEGKSAKMSARWTVHAVLIKLGQDSWWAVRYAHECWQCLARHSVAVSLPV
jgi:hypothetical protein